MVSIKAKPHQQQFNIVVREILDEEDLKTLRFLVRREIIKLDTGWTAIVDLRGMRVLEQKLTRYVRELQKIFVDHGVRQIATLVDNKILKMQLERLGEETGINQVCNRFTNERDWRQFLAEASQDNESSSGRH